MPRKKTSNKKKPATSREAVKRTSSKKQGTIATLRRAPLREPMHLKVVVRVIAIQLAIAFGFLILIEIAFRLLGLAPVLHRIRPEISKSAYQWSENTKLGYVMKPNYRDDNPDLHESFPYTNAFGQRDIERKLERDANKKRILVLGDSVVAGHGIYSLDDTISRKLEQLFPKDSTEVLNFGIGGYCTMGEIELLKENGIKFKPDIVVLVFVENDYADTNSQANHYQVTAPTWAKELFVNVHLFRYFAYKFNAFHLAHLGDDLEQLNHDAIGNDNVSQGLKAFRELSEKENFKTVIVVWPTFSANDALDTGHPLGADSKHLRVETLAENLDLKVVRLSPFFKKDYEKRCGSNANPVCSSWNLLYTIGDGMHPSPLGSEVAAQAIYTLVQ